MSAGNLEKYEMAWSCASAAIRALPPRFGGGPSIWQDIWVMVDQSSIGSMSEGCRNGLELLAMEKPRASPQATRDIAAARALLGVAAKVDHGVTAHERIAAGPYGLLPNSHADMYAMRTYSAWRGLPSRYAVARFAEAVRAGDTEPVLRTLRAALQIDAAMSLVDPMANGSSCSPAHADSSAAQLIDWSSRFMQQTPDAAAIAKVAEIWAATPRPDLASRFAVRTAFYRCITAVEPQTRTPEAQKRLEASTAFFEQSCAAVVKTGARPPAERLNDRGVAFEAYAGQRARLKSPSDNWPEPRRIASDLLAIDHRDLRFAAIPVIAAIETHRRTTGSLPKKLSDIKPAMQVPLDPFSGKEMRYQVRGKSDFVLYSVGIDGQDQGGLAAPSETVDGVLKCYHPTLGIGCDLLLNKP